MFEGKPAKYALLVYYKEIKIFLQKLKKDILGEKLTWGT
jgi:hypothetical protein